MPPSSSTAAAAQQQQQQRQCQRSSNAVPPLHVCHDRAWWLASETYGSNSLSKQLKASTIMHHHLLCDCDG
jgi:hypothetical protein